MACGDFEDLTRRTAADKVLWDKVFNMLKIKNMMDVNVCRLQWFINILIKKNPGGEVKNQIMSNKELAKELHKPIIRKFEKRIIDSSLIDNIWSTDLADI